MTRRRNHLKDAETRHMLIDIGLEILRDQGYSAVSCRRIAARAGLSHQIVHYYFRSMEELFRQLIGRAAERQIESLTRALVAPQPLWSLWELISDKSGARLEMEYMAIANHYPKISEEQGEYRARYRNMQIEALTGLLAKYNFDTQIFSPTTISVFVGSVARMMALESSHGVTVGHDETRDLIEQFITKIEGPRKKSNTQRANSA